MSRRWRICRVLIASHYKKAKTEPDVLIAYGNSIAANRMMILAPIAVQEAVTGTPTRTRSPERCQYLLDKACTATPYSSWDEKNIIITVLRFRPIRETISSVEIEFARTRIHQQISRRNLGRLKRGPGPKAGEPYACQGFSHSGKAWRIVLDHLAEIHKRLKRAVLQKVCPPRIFGQL